MLAVVSRGFGGVIPCIRGAACITTLGLDSRGGEACEAADVLVVSSESDIGLSLSLSVSKTLAGS